MLKNISSVVPSWWLDVEKKLVHQLVYQHGRGGHTTPCQWETIAKHREFKLFCIQRTDVTSIRMTFPLD